MNYYLGVDIGTGSCKAVAFDERGRPVAEASREYNLITSQPGWAELDPNDVIQDFIGSFGEDKLYRITEQTPQPMLSKPEPSGTVAGIIPGKLCNSLNLTEVALEILLNLEILEASGCEVKELRAIGGGAMSARHNQLKADIIGRPITVLDVAEAGCLGVAMLARSAKTGIQVERICKDWVRTVNQVTPEPGDLHSQRYEVYKKMYRHISPLLNELNHAVKKR